MLNLFDILLESFDIEKLINEGKDPVELIHYKFQNVPSDVIDGVLAIDPTKKKSYTQWTLSRWDKENDLIVKCLEDGKLQKLFQHYATHNAIQIKDLKSLSSGIRDYVADYDSVLSKSSKPETYLFNIDRYVDSKLANDFDIVYEDNEWLIAVPNTYEANCKLGERTNWCTAGGRGDTDMYFNNYIENYGGKYYVNFKLNCPQSIDGKDYPYTRYQFHFESNQFMDVEDEDVDVSNIGLNEGVVNFYGEEGYNTSKFENEEIRRNHYEELRKQDIIKLTETLYLAPYYNNNYIHTDVDENTKYYVFSTADDRDPMSTDVIDIHEKNNGVLYMNEYEKLAVLKKLGEQTYQYIMAYSDGNGRNNICVDINQYIVNKEVDIVVGVGYQFYFGYESGIDAYPNLQYGANNKLFINEECYEIRKRKLGSDLYGVFEVVNSINSYHSLFEVSSYGIKAIIKYDIPINGEMFKVNENNVIECKYKNYDINWLDNKNADESYKWQLYKETNHGNFIIKKESNIKLSNYERFVYNVVDKNTKELLFGDEWMKKITEILCGHNTIIYYVQETDDTYAIFNVNGMQITENYDKEIKKINEFKGIFCGISDNKIELFNVLNGHFLGYYDNIYPAIQSFNSFCITVTTLKDKKMKLLDYDRECFIYDDYELFRIPRTKLLIGLKDNNFVFINKNNSEIVLSNISQVEKVSQFIYSIQYTENGKYNLIQITDYNGDIKKILDKDVDSITCVDENTSTVIIENNNLIYIYDAKYNEYLLNNNGIPKQYVFDISGKYIIFRRDNIILYYDVVNCDFINRTNSLQECDFINFLKDYNNQQITENFYKYFNKMKKR